ncbi:MAG: hypothetical protein J6T41_03040 [Neisseriaceae bacterium]|nr:hypothetical protein [Neisseriaceae bacterium]
MEETLSIHCRKRFFLDYSDYGLTACFLWIISFLFVSFYFPNIKKLELIAIEVALFFISFIIVYKIFSHLNKTIKTINITPTGIEFVQSNINQQLLFFWHNIQTIKYISLSNYHHYDIRVKKQRYNEKISIQTKDKQTKTFVFALDTQYGKKKQQPEYLINDEPIYDKLHKEIYQILQHYTLRHQIQYIQPNTDDITEEIPLSLVSKILIFVLEVIVFLFLTAVLAVIIWFMIDRIELGLLVLAIPILISWCAITALLVKHIKQRKNK